MFPTKKSSTGLIWQFAHPFSLNTGGPGHLADKILGISGVVYPQTYRYVIIMDIMD